MAARDATADDLPPEFDAVDPGQVNYALSLARIKASIVAFGEHTSELQALYASHVLKGHGLGTNSSTSSSNTRVQVGSVSRSNVSNASGDLQKTEYGKRFLDLARAFPSGPMAI